MFGLDFGYEIYANYERILRGFWFLQSYEMLGHVDWQMVTIALRDRISSN